MGWDGVYLEDGGDLCGAGHHGGAGGGHHLLQERRAAGPTGPYRNARRWAQLVALIRWPAGGGRRVECQP